MDVVPYKSGYTPPHVRAASRALRLAATAANGGVAPVASHNASTYRNWGCKCATCRADHTEKCYRAYRNRVYRTMANGGIAPTKVHNAATRRNWRCGCATCFADAMRERKGQNLIAYKKRKRNG